MDFEVQVRRRVHGVAGLAHRAHHRLRAHRIAGLDEQLVEMTVEKAIARIILEPDIIAIGVVPQVLNYSVYTIIFSEKFIRNCLTIA